MKKFVTLILCLLLHHAVFLQQTQHFVKAISASADDAEEKFDGSFVTLTSSDLELVFDTWNSQGNQTVGVRFTGVTIPKEANIVNAYIQFNADGASEGDVNLLIKGELAGFAQPYQNTPNNISGRNTTAASVQWTNIPAWIGNQQGVAQRTPELNNLISEMISNPAWQQGNPLAFIITGEGVRRARSFDGTITRAPVLVVEYINTNTIYHDLAIQSLVSPQAIVYANASVPVSVQVVNNGLLPQNAFDMKMTFNGITYTESVETTLNQGESMLFTFSQTLDLQVTDTYQLEIEIVLPNDQVIFNNHLSLTVLSVVEIESLFFSQGAPWKYLDNGSDQGSAWQAINYDDSNWKIGVGHMGFGDGDETTLLTPGFITYYFRKIVNIPDTSQLDRIYFHIVHDDGALLHVNGVEVVRSALMPEGPINYLTGTTTFIPNDLENSFWTYEVSKEHFVPGLNILAIEVHNQNFSSSDVSFDCYVTDFYTQTYQLDGPYVFYRNNEIIVKTIEEDGPKTYTYTSPEQVVLTCRFNDGVDTFNVQLKPQLTIEPSIYELPDKFLAVSDIEGNIEAFIMLLIDAGVMDANYNWTYGAGHLFFVGDLFDRGTNVTECLWLLYRLESQAEAVGGKIHFIIGNHDIMNLIGDFRYVAEKYVSNVALMSETLLSVYAQDTELGRWLRTKNVIERAGPVIFVHAGISPAIYDLNLSYDQINYWGRFRMNQPCSGPPCSIINGGSATGIYWYRGMAQNALTQDQVNEIVAAFNGEQVVIGHTLFPSISLLYQGRVVAIDLNHTSNFQNGFMEALYYENGMLYNFYTNGTTQEITPLGGLITHINDGPNNEVRLNVFPNPAKKGITIQIELPAEWAIQHHPSAVIELYDITGRKVASDVFRLIHNQSNIVSLKSNDIDPGIYILRAYTNGKSISQRLVITN